MNQHTEAPGVLASALNQHTEPLTILASVLNQHTEQPGWLFSDLPKAAWVLITPSSFSETRLKPIAKKRLEASPQREFLIEFMAKSIAQNTRFSDRPNDLNSQCSFASNGGVIHLRLGRAKDCTLALIRFRYGLSALPTE